MPLRVAVRKDTGKLWITGTISPAGSKERFRVRQRAGTDDRSLAEEEAAAVERDILRNFHLGERPVERGFAAAVTSYLKAEARAPGTVALVQRLLRHFANTPLRRIDQEAVDKARDVMLRPDAAPGTVRRNLIVPLRAILLHAHRRRWCDAPEFELPSEPEGRTRFLLPEQFETLCGEAPERLRPLLRFLICTGCRVGETLALEWDQVDLQAGHARLWADQTKAGRSRLVTLPPAAVLALAGLPGREGHVFRSRYKDGAGGFLPYRASDEGGGGQIGGAFGRAAQRAGAPWATPHVLRHSWASWHYSLHRDLLALKEAGGWSSAALVERYAHLVPAGQEGAIRRVWGTDGPVVVGEMRA